MLTLFACPKGFEGHIGLIQRNAIASWTRLPCRPEILLLGEEEGISEIAKEFGAIHLSGVQTNEFGTPLVNSLFELAESEAKHPVLCYINSDILLTGDFVSAIEHVHRLVPHSVIVGRRTNLDVREKLQFERGWEKEMKERASRNGTVGRHDAIDFFVFRKGAFGEILPFALGRCAWDGWLLYKAKILNHPVVDISGSAMVIHQNHEYAKNDDHYRDVEYRNNWNLIGGFPWEGGKSYLYSYTISDADYKFGKGGLRKNLSVFKLWRRFLTLSSSVGGLVLIIRMIKLVRFHYRTRIQRERWK